MSPGRVSFDSLRVTMIGVLLEKWARVWDAYCLAMYGTLWLKGGLTHVLYNFSKSYPTCVCPLGHCCR